MAEPTGNNPDTHITETPKSEPPPTAVTPKPATDKPAAAAPKPAAKPAAKASAKAAPTRRVAVFSLVGSWVAVAWTTFTLSMIGMLLGTVRFLFPNVLS